MTTTIHSNGSKWAGEEPDSLDTLCEVLQSNPLDRSFEEFGNFIIKPTVKYDRVVHFWGNFALAMGKRGASELNPDARLEITEIVDAIIDAVKVSIARSKP